MTAGFGSINALHVVGGAHTKRRMDSMEKIFCSQGLASPLEPLGAAR